MASQVPVIGTWYQDAVEDQIFEVVAVDDDAGSVEIQYVDGEVSEFDFETWQQMLLLSAKPPEDWRASYELSDEDRSITDDVFVPVNWNDPLSDLDFDTTLGVDDL
ncbi:MAG: hypothetical protein COA46_02735 [Porticoccaceae bacterium]|nr:MAG: hypothetical protein COA46_02735 [Porticoccaceae bacterium]